MVEPYTYKPSTATWPTNAFDELKAVDVNARRVARIAHAARVLHQHELADELFEIHDTLISASKSLLDIVGNVTSERLRDAEQSTANMLGAVLAMARRDEPTVVTAAAVIPIRTISDLCPKKPHTPPTPAASNG